MLIDLITFGSVEPLAEIDVENKKLWISEKLSKVNNGVELCGEVLTVKTLEQLLCFKMDMFIEASNKAKEASLLKEIETIKTTINIIREFELPL